MAKRRRKLRSLVPKESAQLKPKRSLQFLIFLALLLSGVLFAIHFNNGNTILVWTNFFKTYRKQYYSVAHGEEDYCAPIIDTAKLFAEIGNEVLNQKAALSNIEQQFRMDSRFTAIALIGTSGIGKSLFAQTLNDHFPWQENTQIYSWSDYNPENEKKEDVLMFLNYLSDCGRNLIIIDNLGSEEVDFVQEYNEYSLKHVLQIKANLIVIYVFNVVTYTDEQQEQYDDKMEALQQLENVQIVNFKIFNSNDLKDCIRHEARNLNLTLDNSGFEEVFKSIDVERSGCKNVRSKVMMYGEIREY